MVKKIETIALLLGIISTLLYAERSPNVVIFLVDDMGWKDLGCFGAELYETPNIDTLCSSGMRFSQAYTSVSICSPARASLLSGKHPLRFGMWNHTHYITPGQKVLPQYLKEAGYQTWHVGKWHLGNPKEKTMPTDLGFDANIGGSISWGPRSYFWPYGHPPGSNKPLARTGVPGLGEGGKEGEQLTDRLTNEAIALIDRRDAGKPFYLNFWYYSVHNYKEAKPELIEKYTRKIAVMGLSETFRHDPSTGSDFLTSETNPTYAAMLETVDDSVGRIVERLKAIKEYDNTLFIFFSDNGSTVDDVPCAPLRGGKNSNYEGGVRVPGFAVWPGHITPGSEYSSVVSICDIFETVLEAVGHPKPDSHQTDGTSWLPVFSGGKLEPRQLVWYFPRGQPKWGQRPSAAIYDEKSRMKYIMLFNGEEDELFDLRNDIGETTNLINQRPEVANSLRKDLKLFLSENLKGSYAPSAKTLDVMKERLELEPDIEMRKNRKK